MSDNTAPDADNTVDADVKDPDAVVAQDAVVIDDDETDSS